jgi:predicted nucleic acid-binding Zn ribbon protein
MSMRKDSRGTEALADVLGKLFVARGWGRVSERAKLAAAWAVAAGETTAVATRVLGLRRGVLEVEVRSGVLLQELAQFQKRTLLKSLRQSMPHITVTDLKFRSGSW